MSNRQPRKMPSFFNCLMMAVFLYPLQSTSEPILPRETVELRQASSNPNALLAGWTPVGCFTDASQLRTLLGPSFTSSSMTPAACMDFCAPHGFGFAGVEYSRECYCDFVIQDFATPVSASDCNAPCAGDGTLTCGSANRISVFANEQSNVVHPSNKPFVGAWQYKGCFTENVRGRNLERMVGISGPVTVETCTAACKSSNFLLAGLENAGECWCGNVMEEGTKTPDADCGSACSGDPTEFCGSSVQNGGPTETTRMTVYQDTSTAVNFKTCLQSGSDFFLRLNIFSQAAPSNPVPALLLQDATFPSDFFVLTACATCSTVNVVAYGAEFGVLTAIRSFPQNIEPQSFSVNVGDSPAFKNTQVFQAAAGFSGYCGMANPINPIGPLFQPLLLGANSRADLWALCPNITAGGRLDVVFSPVANHAHYLKNDCQAVFIQMDPTSV
ncbi:hypothetical protein GALMADRAFT_244894 [Galerina marginata CBS 339.88]|uniref:WSC domain-containing protein n=1 Tax=Galerina marginata (strain CBS 339.88) TaxID=685588 RepID=A0A067TG43_GALM3|nr:hypothetical protein GALMADRAFT_244894 [Galerina marginata CBS 339.88]